MTITIPEPLTATVRRTPAVGVTVVAAGEATFAAADGVIYPLTGCCAASGKGSVGGVVCRACYELVSPMFGAAAMADDHVGSVRLVAEHLRVLHPETPTPDAVAVQVVAMLTGTDQ